MKRYMVSGGLLAALVISPALARDPGTVQSRTASEGGTQVHISGTTNISTKVIVQTIGPNGEKNVQIFNGGGPGSAAPGSAAAAAAEPAEAAEKVSWLGVTTESASDELREQLSLDPGVGLTVHGVAPGSPAEKAGLKPHDVITRLGDQKLMDPDQLRNLVLARKPGESVGLTYLRKGKEATATATLAEHADTGGEGNRVINLGDFNLDIGKIMGQFPQAGQMMGGPAMGTSTGSCSGTSTIIVGPSGLQNFSSGDANVTKAIQEMLRNLKSSDSNVSKAVEEAIQSLEQAQPGASQHK